MHKYSPISCPHAFANGHQNKLLCNIRAEEFTARCMTHHGLWCAGMYWARSSAMARTGLCASAKRQAQVRGVGRGSRLWAVVVSKVNTPAFSVAVSGFYEVSLPAASLYGGECYAAIAVVLGHLPLYPLPYLPALLFPCPARAHYLPPTPPLLLHLHYTSSMSFTPPLPPLYTSCLCLTPHPHPLQRMWWQSSQWMHHAFAA